MSEKDTHDTAPVSDEVQTELKGPDPEVWGEDSERPDSAGLAASGVEPGEIQSEGEEDELKGPDPDVWQRSSDSDGNYVNR